MPLWIQVPYQTWRCQGAFRRWLEQHGVTGFFWEVAWHDGLVTIEVFD